MLAAFPKDIVILVDVAEGMQLAANQYPEVQSAVTALLSTVSPRDRVTVITVSNTTRRAPGCDGLRVGTSDNIDVLRKFVDESRAESAIANWTSAWDAADSALNSTGRVATRLLVVVGSGSKGDGGRARASQLVATYRVSRPVQAFTFCVGCVNDVRDTLKTHLATSTSGSFWDASDGATSLRCAMSSIYSTATAVNESGPTRVDWVLPSLDRGNRTVARVGMRVVNSKTQKLIGAVLVEVPLLDVFAGVVGSIPRVSQLSYGFVVDSDGVVWTHPALSLPSLNDTSSPRTALLESVEPAFNASAWERLRRRENGSVDLTVSIVCMTHAHRVCDADLVLWA
jgi:hypothetical protein